MKLLLSSYSFGAGRGSEAGVGWNVAAGMAARGHDVTVLTTSEFHALNFPDGIAPCFRILEYDFDLKVFNSASSYNRWQKLIGPEIEKLFQNEHFDLIHHITFNQYRRLNDVFAARNIPYVIGPIGGAETVAPCFWNELPFKQACKEMLRYLPVDVCALGLRIRKHAPKGIVIASTPQTAHRLRKWAGMENVELSPIISVRADEISRETVVKTDMPYMIFDGGTRPEKGLKLLLKAMSCMWRKGVEVPIKVAAVPVDDVSSLQQYIKKVGLTERAVEIMPFMKRAELLELVKKASAFVSIGFRDAGCMALLEALALGVPSLCLNHAGQFWLSEKYACKISVEEAANPELLAQKLMELIAAPARDKEWHEQRADWLQQNMSWESRLTYLESVYQRVVEMNA